MMSTNYTEGTPKLDYFSRLNLVSFVTFNCDISFTEGNFGVDYFVYLLDKLCRKTQYILLFQPVDIYINLNPSAQCVNIKVSIPVHLQVHTFTFSTLRLFSTPLPSPLLSRPDPYPGSASSGPP